MLKSLGFDLFISRGLYGARPASHLSARKMAPGWYFIEVGSLTAEVTVPCLHIRRRWLVLAGLAGTTFSPQLVSATEVLRKLGYLLTSIH